MDILLRRIKNLRPRFSGKAEFVNKLLRSCKENSQIRNNSPRWKHCVKVSSILLAVMVVADVLIITAKWPFTRTATITSLERVSASNVQIDGFEQRFLPHPGYVARNVRFVRGTNLPPLAQIRQLTCEASWLAILSFTHRIKKIELIGLQVKIPQHVPAAVHKHAKTSISTTVADLYAPGARLQIARKSSASGMEQFDFPQLHVGGLASSKPLAFEATILDPQLIGKVEVTGSLGPLELNNLKQMKLEGRYRFSDLDLDKYKAIAGTVSGRGRFEGRLGETQIIGQTSIRGFEVTQSGHPQDLSAEFQAVVDGTRGDVTIHSVAAHFLSTTLIARGALNGSSEKLLVLDIESRHARAEDVLWMFSSSNPEPLAGTLSFRAHVVIPSGRQPFLERVQLRGSFTIEKALFTRKPTEAKLNELSLRARGIKHHSPPGQITAEMGSSVVFRRETALLSDAFFTVPGATVKGGGTCDLHDQRIDLHGKLAMRASLSKATKGIKSVLVTPLDPFFKKNGYGSVLPLHITGTYSRPKYKLSL